MRPGPLSEPPRLAPGGLLAASDVGMMVEGVLAVFAREAHISSASLVRLQGAQQEQRAGGK